MQRTIIHVWPCLNDSPPVNVFRTDDTKAAAFAETKQTETMWQKVYENYKLNSWEPESKEFWPHGLIKLFCHLECFFPREANFGGFNGSAILLHSNSQGNLKWYFEPSFALTKFCQNVGNGISGNLGFNYTVYQGWGEDPCCSKSYISCFWIARICHFLPLDLEDTVSIAKSGYFIKSTPFWWLNMQYRVLMCL